MHKQWKSEKIKFDGAKSLMEELTGAFYAVYTVSVCRVTLIF